MLIKIDHDFHERLTNTEKQVINFINMNVDKISAMSILDVAEATYSSPATVSRTIKKCGISGFAELRYLLTQQTETKKDSADVNESAIARQRLYNAVISLADLDLVPDILSALTAGSLSYAAD